MKRMKPKDLNRQIGTQIYKVRIARCLSQASLAEAADISRVFVSNLENGNQSAKVDTYYRIACALGISLSELFRGDLDTGAVADILLLLGDCSDDEIRAYIEIIRVVKIQCNSLRR